MIDQILFDQHSRNCKVDEEISISIFHTEHLEKHNRTDTYNHFIFSQVLIDALLLIPITNREKQDLYTRYKREHQSNKAELQQIGIFESKYAAVDAIRWFVDNSFLVKKLTETLQVQNLDLLFPFRFFIYNIHEQINKYKYQSTIDVYRSQLMSKDLLQKFQESRQQFISINSFLWALHNRTAAMSILRKTPVKEDTERVLFEIHADGNQEGIKPFSCIKSNVQNGPEELLFSIGSIFRLEDVRLAEGSIWIIQMTLCADTDPLLKPLMDDIHERFGDTTTSPFSFGLVLRHLHKYDEARKFYECVRGVYAEYPQRVQECDQALNQIFIDRENYTQPLYFIEDTVTRKKAKMAVNNEVLRYIQDGQEYEENAQLKLALDCYGRALEILIESNNRDDPQVGRCLKLIASIYHKEEDYMKALDYYEKAKVHLETNLGYHPDLSTICINIGDVHRHLTHYDQAIESYQKAMDVAERTSIPQWELIVAIRNKLASVYELKNDLSNALAQYEKIVLQLPAINGDPHEVNQNIQRLRARIQ